METEQLNQEAKLVNHIKTIGQDHFLQKLDLQIDNLIENLELLKMESSDLKQENQELKNELEIEKNTTTALKSKVHDLEIGYAELENYLNSILKKITNTTRTYNGPHITTNLETAVCEFESV